MPCIGLSQQMPIAPAENRFTTKRVMFIALVCLGAIYVGTAITIGSKRYVMYLEINPMRKFIIVLLLFVIACAPAPPPPDTIEPVYLNDNPELALGACKLRTFTNAAGNKETITQCVPAGYTLYEVTMGIPIRAVYTGAAYSILPHSGYGGIGYSQATRLGEGCYLVKVDGFIHFWGAAGDASIIAHWQTEDMDNYVVMGQHPIEANGDYLAVFVLNIPARADYHVSVYLWLQHPSNTADSYMTFESITIEAVDSGHCEGA